jgi:N-acetylglucosaminyldiphosphoundecaprenol N-acetyl-beta-D-mannosaminyltransferase
LTQRHEADDWPAGKLPQVNILGTNVHIIDFAGVLSWLDAWINPAIAVMAVDSRQAHCRQICTVNPEFIVEARYDSHFSAVLRRADLRVPDGVGVLLAARLLGVRLRERVTGSDGIYRICRHAAGRGWRIFFLGAGPGVAEKTACKLQQLYPGLNVAGAYAGSPNEEDWPAIRERLEKTRPDILFVAYGHPRQDWWIDYHRSELPVRVAIGVGGAFDFVAGIATRAPGWVRSLGLEWLHRLARQPWRWRRMRKLPKFVFLVLWQALSGQ